MRYVGAASYVPGGGIKNYLSRRGTARSCCVAINLEHDLLQPIASDHQDNKVQFDRLVDQAAADGHSRDDPLRDQYRFRHLLRDMPEGLDAGAVFTAKLLEREDPLGTPDASSRRHCFPRSRHP